MIVCKSGEINALYTAHNTDNIKQTGNVKSSYISLQQTHSRGRKVHHRLRLASLRWWTGFSESMLVSGYVWDMKSKQANVHCKIDQNILNSDRTMFFCNRGLGSAVKYGTICLLIKKIPILHYLNVLVVLTHQLPYSWWYRYHSGQVPVGTLCEFFACFCKLFQIKREKSIDRKA